MMIINDLCKFFESKTCWKSARFNLKSNLASTVVFRQNVRIIFCNTEKWSIGKNTSNCSTSITEL